FIQNNVELIITMLELARRFQPKVFLQVSTDEVYGSAPLGTRYREWDTILPSNPYAASKAAQEAIAISYWRTYDVPLVITNTVNNFGENQDNEKYLSRLIKQIHTGETVTIHGNDQYIGGRYYLYVDNHADAIRHIIQNLPVKMCKGEQDRPLRFNVTSDDELDNREAAILVAELMGKELKYKLVDFHTERKGHDRRYALDGTKLKETGWVMPFGLKESLKKYIDWSLNNKRWLD
ncbi:MAG: GDP-mannose 4,6-dehydratase, partial [Candidatus Paceibacterota bacterium]